MSQEETEVEKSLGFSLGGMFEDKEEKSPEEVKVAPEPEEDVEEQEQEDQEEPEEKVDTSSRAQKRIQQLASQKKELNTKNAELEALVEQLKRSNDLQGKLQERQDKFFSAQENQSKNQSRRQLMLQYGLNPEDTRDAIAFEQMEYKAQLEQKLNEVQEKLRAQEEHAQIEQFTKALDVGLSRRLKEYNVPAEILEDMKEVAYDAAQLKGLTAGEAADLAIKRFQKVLPKKASTKPAKADEAAKLVAQSSGRTKPKAPGQANVKSKDFLEYLDSGNFKL